MAARGGVFLPLLLLLVGVSAVPAKPQEFEKNGEVEVLNITKLGKLIETRKWLDEAEVEVFDDVDLVAGETVEEGNRQYWSPNCPSGFYKYWSASNVASICYTIGTTKKDWFDAKEACERLTPPSSRCFSTLASVMNGNENHFISTLM
ncbi:uncharacterized protein LOC122377196, partial [Amphibalanus amphitrite]|uniref:uncharacterized protein LOC122377196 n=1 Tax=Amphibalanus amphitrite TaxID=1232801 RepID=UPI001C90021C